MSRDSVMEPNESVLDSERAILGAMLVDPTAIIEAHRFLTPDRLWARSSQIVFRAIVAMHVAGKPIDLVSLSNELTSNGDLAACGGLPFIAGLVDRAVAASSVQHHASLVAADWQRRERIRLGRDYLSAAHDPSLAADRLQRIVDLESSGSVAHGAWAEASLDWETLSRMDIQPTPSIAGPDGLLPVGGLIFLSGAPGTGKTFLAMQLALALGSGGEWLGHRCHPMNVGFLELEMDLASVRDRIVRSSPHVGLDRINIITQPKGGATITDRDVRRRMVEWIRRFSIQVLFIDPFNRLQDDTGNPSKDARAELSGLHAVREETGVTIILLHHIRKSPAGEKKQSGRVEAIQNMRGSAQYGDDADTMLELEDKGELRLLRWAKVRHAESPEPTWLARTATGFLHVVAAPGEVAAERRSDAHGQLIAWVSAAGELGVTASEAARHLGCSSRWAISQLAAIGAVKGRRVHGNEVRWFMPTDAQLSVGLPS